MASACLGAALAACGAGGDTATIAAKESAPHAAAMRFGASPRVVARFEDAGLLEPELDAARLAAVLAFYFGAAGSPRYWPPATWREAGRDSSFGQDELPPAVLDTIRAESEARFGYQLAFVRNDAFAEVPEPRNAEGPWSAWRREFGALASGEVQATDDHPRADETWGDAATRFWSEYYPNLPESAALFAEHCASCHGTTGAGDGALGLAVDPRPRDFTLGVFKWSPATRSGRPRRVDLIHTLERGVPGTTMKAFTALSTAEREGLADWVRYLAVRGETERLAAELAAAEGALEPSHVERAYLLVWSRWDAAASEEHTTPKAPPDLAGLASLGAPLFERAGCVTCHGPDGHGDGPAVWEEGPEGRRRRLDAWGAPSRPRDLATEPLHGGDTPEDLFRIVRTGIPGTIMPAAAADLTDEEVWGLVAHVLHLRERR